MVGYRGKGRGFYLLNIDVIVFQPFEDILMKLRISKVKRQRAGQNNERLRDDIFARALGSLFWNVFKVELRFKVEESGVFWRDRPRKRDPKRSIESRRFFSLFGLR